MKKKFVTVCDISQERVRWLWPGRIAYGTISLVVGSPGAGKGAMMCDLIARVTTGMPMYDCPGKPAPHGAIMISGEDDLHSSIKPRLTAARAATRLVRVLDCAAGVKFELPADIPVLAREVANSHARLIVLDPLMCFVGGNANSDKAMRKALAPLAALASQTEAAVVLVHHLAKARGSALQRAAGSIGIVGLVRSAMLLAQLPHAPNQCVLAHVKSNLGPLTQSLTFEKITRDGAAAINWVGPSNLTADDLTGSIACEDGSVLSDAMRVLFAILGQGAVDAKTATRKAAEAGIAGATIKRAKRALSVQSQRIGFGPGSQFFWTLDEENSAVRQFREEELSRLSDQLFNGGEEDDYPDEADWWKRGPQPG